MKKMAIFFRKKLLTHKKKYDIINRVLRKQSHGKAQIAQSVEQGTENPCVAGSIPALGISTAKKW